MKNRIAKYANVRLDSYFALDSKNIIMYGIKAYRVSDI